MCITYNLSGAIALSDAADGYEMLNNGSDFGGCMKEQTDGDDKVTVWSPQVHKL